METIFSNLNKLQIVGLILMVIMLPLFIYAAHIWNLAHQSKFWPKANGVIEIVHGFIGSKRVLLEYRYEVNGIAYDHHRIFFTTSNDYPLKRAIQFKKEYHQGQEVIVFYHPKKPKMAVLQPGRKDGVLVSLFIGIVFFIFGYIAFFDQYLFIEIIQLFN